VDARGRAEVDGAVDLVADLGPAQLRVRPQGIAAPADEAAEAGIGLLEFAEAAAEVVVLAAVAGEGAID
jgi:hypothetical protein